MYTPGPRQEVMFLESKRTSLLAFSSRPEWLEEKLFSGRIEAIEEPALEGDSTHVYLNVITSGIVEVCLPGHIVGIYPNGVLYVRRQFVPPRLGSARLNHPYVWAGHIPNPYHNPTIKGLNHVEHTR